MLLDGVGKGQWAVRWRSNWEGSCVVMWEVWKEPMEGMTEGVGSMFSGWSV
jgi:hypothetical protein